MRDKTGMQEWTARGLIAIVLGMNLACAIDFIARPNLYLGAYELSGEVGRVVIIGFGILFLMWQVPYFFALFHPYRYRIALIQAILMQTIGFIGESLLLRTIPTQHAVLRESILRFVYFDGGGLLLLILAFLIGSRTHFTKTELSS
jgi:hypothetical protein